MYPFSSERSPLAGKHESPPGQLARRCQVSALARVQDRCSPLSLGEPTFSCGTAPIAYRQKALAFHSYGCQISKTYGRGFGKLRLHY